MCRYRAELEEIGEPSSSDEDEPYAYDTGGCFGFFSRGAPADGLSPPAVHLSRAHGRLGLAGRNKVADMADDALNYALDKKGDKPGAGRVDEAPHPKPLQTLPVRVRCAAGSTGALGLRVWRG